MKRPSDKMNFTALLADVKLRIQSAQTRAMMSVNSELVRLYWDVGRLIDLRQKKEGWGAGVIPRLASELKNELPELKGFSERNIGRMISFYREYPDSGTILQHPVAKLNTVPILPPPVAKLSQCPAHQEVVSIMPLAVAQLTRELLWIVPWAHHVILMEKIRNVSTRRWYMEQSVANGWTRDFLSVQIEKRAHKRHGKITSNFAQTLPPSQSDLVQQMLKDPYIFDFLTMTQPYREKDIENQLIQHIAKFLLELGKGFAFVGQQHHLAIADSDYYLDLLFYHIQLKCYVVIELKNTKFIALYLIV